MSGDLNIRTMAMAAQIQRIIASVPEEEWAAISKMSETDQTAAIERIVARATEQPS